MTFSLLCLSLSVGWAQDAPKQSPLETTITQTLDRLIRQQSMNIEITTLSMKSDSVTVFQLEGAAHDKGSIKQLIKAMDAEPSTRNPYLVSITPGTVDGAARDLFVMTTEYAAKE